jgi:hypothetical protein
VKAPLFLALLHHPVIDRHGQVVTTSITNMDVHDIARASRTFGVRRFYVVHPIPALRALAERIVEHWQSGYGSSYNPSRREAIALTEVTPDLDHALAAAERECGRLPRLVSTSARRRPGSVTFEELRRRLERDDEPSMLLLGTGYGLADEVLARCDTHLEPIIGVDDYNHLSVRAAAAILLDRLVTVGKRS